jgi:siroheme synthase (precorrin-2 oxidase/ferrochelatase)
MRFLPLFFDLTAGPVILAGAGREALAKLRILKAAGARIRWHVLSHEAVDEANAQDVELRIDCLAMRIFSASSRLSRQQDGSSMSDSRRGRAR